MFDVAVEKTAQKILLVAELDTAESDMLSWQRAMMLYTFEKDSGTVANARDRFHKASEIAARSLEAIRPLIVDTEGQRLVDGTAARLTQWVAAFSEIDRLFTLLQNPFSHQPGMDTYALPPPNWGKHVTVSCSS